MHDLDMGPIKGDYHKIRIIHHRMLPGILGSRTDRGTTITSYTTLVSNGLAATLWRPLPCERGGYLRRECSFGWKIIERPSGLRHERWKTVGGVSEGRGEGANNRCIGARNIVKGGHTFMPTKAKEEEKVVKSCLTKSRTRLGYNRAGGDLRDD